MSIYIIFGLPGAGKTFVGKVFEEYFKYYFYEGDDCLTDEMKQAINTQSVITEEMRDRFISKIITLLKELKTKHPKIVLAQTFIKEKYRQALLNEIPNAKFILVESDNNIRKSRLNNRHDYPLDEDYADKMCQNFDLPRIKHQIITNNAEGKENLVKQIKLININQL